MQCARYESGLDDSPMYDGIGATNTPHQRSLGGTYRVKKGSFIFSQFRIISH